MLNGSKINISNETHDFHVEQARDAGAQVAEYNRHLQAHIHLLETAIENSDDPQERERGRAAIRRLKAGIHGMLKDAKA